MTKPDAGPGPATVICTYRVRAGAEREFVALLERHWPSLKQLGLVTDEPSRIYQGVDETKGPYFVEIFSWKNGEAPQRAHELPEVMAVWEPMGALTEARGGRPPMEFPHVKPLRMSFGDA